MIIDFANLTKAYQEHKENIDRAINDVVSTSRFIMGEEVKQLETLLEEYTGAKYAISCSSGTDALLLGMMALDVEPGDEIITSPFTFIATAETIAFLGAIPVFVDIDESTYNIDVNRIEEKITKRTKVIMPVSLYGQVADMDEINELGRKYKITVIEDAAQSFGATYKGKKSCNLSSIGCTSFFPAKPLGCFGDGGALFTNDEQLSDKIKSMRVHGQTQRYFHKYIGMGGRLDTIQAAVLLEKLKHYENDVKRRQDVAKQYDQNLKDIVITPFIKEDNTSVWAQYSIRVKNRDNIQAILKEKGIPTAVHYPKPLHLQECFEYLKYKKGDFPISEKVSDEIMSLPMNPYVTDQEINYITKQIKSLL
ncbi:DegT/DnrJ/EryC1/StrS aminotransferase family protein [Flavivirga sp. 57AJ16]|uniref:DegT/DnrJ/EryC1/StrS family aminotransferase n=1 Tax=Flavivirga sp. 57AJ16 TaxID=3025307 RepID=UPI0023668DE2|nr:DegT/DnrJ/EryC1/StrS family aminotransferase [Flavivirga sp. 57AJ16]MDD7885928.1 DegT/DnrJ/EryC1/StrS family aminotransferase [Flavivirga sp. 57AJ16]